MTEIISIDVLGKTIVDWYRIAILPEHVTLSEVLTLDNRVWSGEAREEALEVLGYEVLVYGERGSLLLHKREDETMYYYMLFDSDRSTMPFCLGFSIMASNLVRIALHQAGLAEVRGSRTAILPAIMTTLDTPCAVDGPIGPDRQGGSDPNGRLAGIAAPRIGRDTIKTGATTLARYGVSLLRRSGEWAVASGTDSV